MDKELLRVVIIAFGLIIIMGMVAWHFYRNKKSFQDMMFFGNQEYKGTIDPAIVVHTENDDFEIVHKGRKKLMNAEEFLAKLKAKTKPDTQPKTAAKPQPKQPEPEQADAAAHLFGDFDEAFDFDDQPLLDEQPQMAEGDGTPPQDSDEIPDESLEDTPEEPRFIAPDVIQFRVLANSPDGFNGLDMLKAFRIAQLEYGNLKIFERYDANRLVDFGVACMVDHGTFPDHDVDQFYCPGLVFFMQPALLDDAVKVFDDFLEAINIVAVELEGTLLDHEQKPLTNATIKMIRKSL